MTTREELRTASASVDRTGQGPEIALLPAACAASLPVCLGTVVVGALAVYIAATQPVQVPDTTTWWDTGGHKKANPIPAPVTTDTGGQTAPPPAPTPTDPNASWARPLTEEDLGLPEGSLAELKGTFSMSGRTATVRIDMIRGRVENPFEIIEKLSALARAEGATTLRLEGTPANERLQRVLIRRYGLRSEGATDFIEIPLQ